MIQIVKDIKLIWRQVWTFVSTVWTRILFLFCANGIKFGRHFPTIGIPSVNVFLGGTAEIGDSLYMRTGVGVSEVGSAGTRIRVGHNRSLKNRNRVGMSNATIVCEQSVTIGDDVFIGGGVQIFDAHFYSVLANERTVSPHFGVKTEPTSIGSGSFIGTNSLICKGVAVDKEAVVATGSIVIKSVPHSQVFGGDPPVMLR